MDTIVGNPDKWPGAHGGTPEECRAWIEKDAALRAAGNPAPFPRYGSAAEQTSWHARDAELRRTPKTAPPVATPANESGAPTLVGDGLDLPEPLPPLEPYPRAGSDDDKLLWLQRCGVAHIRAGATDDSPALRAIRLEWLEITEAQRERDIAELRAENRELNLKLNDAEKRVIDSLAEGIRERVDTFIEQEVTRQTALLEKRIATVDSRQVTYEGSVLEQLQRDALLLRQRISALELLSPIWVKLHTESSG